MLDIEGTTTPIAFVYQVLFPFARHHLHEYLLENRSTAECQDALRVLRIEWAADVARGEQPPQWNDEDTESALASVRAYVEWLMDRDRKSRGLKLLQGLIWERGYRSGALESDLFPDVAAAVAEWRACGLQVAIYSSGSVLAQRLLFAHTTEGDLTPLFSGFFDTTVGPKTAPDSYRQIAVMLGQPADHLLFVSDSAKELDAARAAGWRVVLCVRPDNPPQPSTDFAVVHRLDEIVVGGSEVVHSALPHEL